MQDLFFISVVAIIYTSLVAFETDIKNDSYSSVARGFVTMGIFNEPSRN